MNLHYLLIKLNKRIGSNSPKFIYLLAAHTLRLRHLYLQFDPVYLCNLACLMCNFSNPEKREKFTRMTEAEIDRIVELFFPYCSNLQLGCDAEPTVYRDYIGLIGKAKKHGIPYISLTTNGQMMNREDITRLDEIGLNEIVFSAHGLTTPVYEKFMVKARFEKFMALLENISASDHRFKLRMNYTVNGENFKDLELLPEFVKKYHFDVVQIRQMLDVGQTGYKVFSLEEHAAEYTAIIKEVKSKLADVKVEIFAEEMLVRNVKPGKSNIFIPAILRRITPLRVWRDDFDWKNENYWDYCQRTGYTRLLWWGILGNTKKLVDSPFGKTAENAGRYY
ncbi:MAG: radical SAM protein [Anaerolineaceae bacterium]